MARFINVIICSLPITEQARTGLALYGIAAYLLTVAYLFPTEFYLHAELHHSECTIQL